MRVKLSAIDPSMRQTARAWGRVAAFNFLSRMMLAILFVAIMVAMGLVSALLRYLQAPQWVDNPGLIFVLGLAWAVPSFSRPQPIGGGNYSALLCAMHGSRMLRPIVVSKPNSR